MLDEIAIHLSSPANLKRLLLSKPELIEEELKKTLQGIEAPQAYKDFLIELVKGNAQEIVDQYMPDLQSTLEELMSQMRGVLPRAVKEGHIKALTKDAAPETRSEGYRSLNWFIRQATQPLILGDIGCLFEIDGKRKFKPYDDKGDAILNVYLPLSKGKLLVGTSYSAPYHVNFSTVNEATAKCSYEYFVSSESSTSKELSSSIGDWAGILTKKELEQLLNEIMNDLERDPLADEFESSGWI